MAAGATPPTRHPWVATSYHGRSRQLSCACIVATELCERLCFYGVSTNFVVYLTEHRGLDDDAAALTIALWQASCYVSPLPLSWLADMPAVGRYRMIVVSSCLSIAGQAILAMSAAAPAGSSSSGRGLVLALGLIALATGGSKSSVGAFGAEQLEADSTSADAYWTAFYAAINVGSLVAGTAIVELQIQCGWVVGFGACAAISLLGLALFVGGGAVLGYSARPGGSAALASSADHDHAAPSRRALRAADLAPLCAPMAALSAFWAVYWHLPLLVLQGERLAGEVPAAVLSTWETAANIALLPLVLAAARTLHVRDEQRLAAGLGATSLALLSAAVLERERAHRLRPASGGLAAPSEAWQLLTYSLLALGESLASVAALHLFDAHAPAGRRSLAQALYLLAQAAGNSLAAGALALAHVLPTRGWPFVAGNIDAGRLDEYFALLAVSMAAAAAMYALFDHRQLLPVPWRRCSAQQSPNGYGSISARRTRDSGAKLLIAADTGMRDHGGASPLLPAHQQPLLPRPAAVREVGGSYSLLANKG